MHGVPLIRFGVTALLHASKGFELCGAVDTVPLARELFVQKKPDLVVLGLTLRAGDGIEFLKHLHKANKAVAALVLSLREDRLSVERAFRAGALAYVAAHDDTSEILTALDQISRGQRYVSASVLRCLGANKKPRGVDIVAAECGALSDRELQVFSLFGRGLGATQVAAELHLSVKTIETHQKRIKEKLGLRSAAEVSERANASMLQSLQRNLQLRKKILRRDSRRSPGASA